MNKRKSKIELLRIISMLLIVLSHYVVHSGYDFHKLPFGINKILLEFGVLGNIGTMLFVLISGYFLVNSDKVKIKKIAKYIFQVMFYSISIYLLLCFFDREVFSFKNLILNFFPITFKRYWFATVYFVIYLFHPYINKFINSLNRDEHKKFIFTAAFLFLILRTITTMDFYGNEIIYFLIFYAIGAYFAKYDDNYFYKKNNSLKVFAFSSVIIYSSILFFNIVGYKITYFNDHATYLLNIYSVFPLLVSTSLFGLFSKKTLYTNNIINKISSLVFGIYLISDNKNLRPIIWGEIFRNINYLNSNFLFLHIIFSILTICCVCIAIEYVRNLFFDKLIYSWMDNFVDKLQDATELKMKNKRGN